MQITRTEDTTEAIPAIVWALIEDGEEIGRLAAHESGLILNIEVVRERRSEGHARRLYEHANAELPLLHVPSWGRSPEGEGFVQAMGGDVMDDEQAAAILGLDLAVVTGEMFRD